MGRNVWWGKDRNHRAHHELDVYLSEIFYTQSSNTRFNGKKSHNSFEQQSECQKKQQTNMLSFAHCIENHTAAAAGCDLSLLYFTSCRDVYKQEDIFFHIYQIKNSRHFVRLCWRLVRLMFDTNLKPPAAL